MPSAPAILARVSLPPELLLLAHVAWSPDARRYAAAWADPEADLPGGAGGAWGRCYAALLTLGTEEGDDCGDALVAVRHRLAAEDPEAFSLFERAAVLPDWLLDQWPVHRVIRLLADARPRENSAVTQGAAA